MEVGKDKEDLILKGKVKVQWGKRMVDLLDNNGNLNVSNILKQIPSSDEIQKSGIYLTEDNEVILCINGIKVKLAGQILEN